ncbi:ATP-binding protein [Candidatus Aerophobetes bacterium]|nr:ATP-binding protein [Candidatus Aerophobetes bacterium]
MESLKYLISEWLESDLPFLVERGMGTGKIPPDVGFVITGVRRSGKTYLIYEIAQKLRREIPHQNIIYINFEDDRLYPLKGDELRKLPDVYFEYFSPNEDYPIWLLLDEVQNIPNWERSIRTFLDRRIARVVVTGSSSKLLPGEIATSLRGRTLTETVYPLGFKEFLRFKEFKVKSPQSLLYSPQKPKVLKFFNEFLEYGGFPQVVLSKEKEELLREYYRAIFYRDIVERFKIRNLSLFENFLKLLIHQNASLFTLGKADNFLKTLGFKITKSTLAEYLFYIKSAFLLFEISLFSYSTKDRLQYPRKIYTIDTGLVNSVTFRYSHNYGRMLENAIFLELLRRGKEVYYWKTKNNYEVDFVIIEGFKVKELIQVVWDISDEKTIKREERALLKAMGEFNLDKGLILTKDYSERKKIKGKEILYQPAWLWILEYE